MRNSVLALMLAWPAAVLAHPGSGIVALSENAVLTGDAVNNGIWQFEKGKLPLKLVRRFHCHWITRGLDGNLYAESLGESGGAWASSVHRLDSAGAHPVAIPSKVQAFLGVFAVGERGEIVFQDGLSVFSESRTGARSRISMARWAGTPPIGDIAAFAWGPGKLLHFVDGPHVRQITARGEVKLLKTLDGPIVHKLYAGPNNTPKIWGLTVDDQRRPILAVPSQGEVVRIEHDGKQTTIAKGSDGWQPVGVATYGSTVFVLESKTQGNQNDGPRVRAVRPGGRIDHLGQATR